jgi:hypothetical protein
MFRAKSSDLSVVKQPWNLSNAQTSAPISNNGGLVENKVSPETKKNKKMSLHINDFSGEHDDKHGFTIGVIVNG